MEYTKGEWYWDYKDGKPFNLRARGHHPLGYEEDKHVLFIADDFLGENSLINKEDAHLIAAAPKMYEALKEIKQLVRACAFDSKVTEQIIASKCFLAIAKAEGR